ncbi:PEP-CTERM domain protein [Oopsacas minuta]|uniref:PEP-CTERM domain protein n=1 Tax=Oopsacas minuta TaxID=111878 RepID=A0AAV7JMT4_9METZ|nr:PEP-CTERM domain protein [Oopsacas minuta]
MAEKTENLNFNNQLNYTRDLITESFNRLIEEVEKKRNYLLQQLDELEVDYKIISIPAQNALADLLKLKQQIDDSLKVNHLMEFKDRQLTDVNAKIQELNKTIEFEIKYSCKEYIFNSLAHILEQIRIDVSVLERDNGKDSMNYFNSSCENLLAPLSIPSSQPKPCVTVCSKGNKPGELNNPRGIAVDDSTSMIYIADYGNSRIQVYNYDGEYISNFTDHIHKHDKPYGMAFHQNSLFVTIVSTHTVHHFTSEGKLLKKIGGKGNDKTKFSSPYGITVGSNNIVYVCDYGNNRLQALTTNLKYSSTIGNGLLDGPLDVKTNENKEILVLDSNIACLHVFNASGDFMRSMLTRGIVSQLTNPCFFDIGCNGVITMTDSSKSVINIFSPEGDLINTLGGSAGEVEFVFPTGIAVRSGNNPVCVFNKRNALLQIF